ncbi:hypothetical protein [Salinithrix halophila]|uniref:Uncharacterized protein n=1 Tax=Salinithrix halophila TaxID=1485204 RepID=A0ABV8JPT3_9BACL
MTIRDTYFLGSSPPFDLPPKEEVSIHLDLEKKPKKRIALNAWFVIKINAQILKRKFRMILPAQNLPCPLSPQDIDIDLQRVPSRKNMVLNAFITLKIHTHTIRRRLRLVFPMRPKMIQVIRYNLSVRGPDITPWVYNTRILNPSL